MTLQDLLKAKGIDLKRTKLVRHNWSNEDVRENYIRKCFDFFQSWQKSGQFNVGDTIVSFLGIEGTTGIFQGCYEVKDYAPFNPGSIPKNYFGHNKNEKYNNTVFYDLKIIDNIYKELIDRLVIEWGKNTRYWCQNADTHQKEVIAIKPIASEIIFTSYENVLISFETLEKIVKNKSAYKEWEDKLSCVAGVYLITDRKTGKHYVGSASGEQGGIWGRWRDYVHSRHGGNKCLTDLISLDPDYCYNFQFSILEILPIKRNKNDILAYETLYKRKLLSREFGYNDN